MCQLGQVVFELHDQASGQKGEVFQHVLTLRVRSGAPEERRQARLVLDKVVTQLPEGLQLSSEPIFKLHV
ncbi:hypothetical protein D3C76_961590 [compost metagenome]